MSPAPDPLIGPAADVDEVERWMRATATTSLVVRRGGDVVMDLCHPPAEPGWYGLDGLAHAGAPEGVGLPFTPVGGRVAHDVASAQKSVIALLCAVAADRGLLSFDDRVSDHLGAGWSRAEPAHERAITVRHLLSMTSGLGDDLSSAAPPGARWHYSLGPVWHQLKPLVEAASGEGLDEVTDRWLSQRIGLSHTEWVDRPGMTYLDGRPIEALLCTADDLGRVGELVLRRGRWGDDQVVSEGRIDELLTPSQDLNPAYGLLWWLNGRRPLLLPMSDEAIDRVLLPSAPDDAVCALGAMGQVCAVSAERGVVIVRLGGVAPAAGGGADMAAMSGGAVADELWRVLPTDLVGRPA